MKNNEYMNDLIVKVNLRICKIMKYIKSNKPLEYLQNRTAKIPWIVENRREHHCQY